ncbi:hypothetical protein SIAM614_26031 [Stappia aggregata IAM 12614]|uniref:Uncharacterized protein n=1 Tax=Roseibium aggregatum (strain ATCC 25650 / DSM 13394 / JCM 20685 / NBRC 16684 / NCIMB 2208 / IAM 12614 / B1) TaxID=384765 RepID=A0NZU2_ROSAI|nr:hypothetical protein [Roseibium aggregatum]EAV41659.1 hypothetical protein SIAM614_26031 [Stappia aggregata IAM 12614] [Roseibium aggregatum IAM 12614]
MKRLRLSLLALSGLLAALQAATAAPIESTYTKILLDGCQLITSPDEEEGTFGGAWQCAGYKGTGVYVAEGDLRMFVSFGPDAANEPAAGQTLPSFNSVNETLEWRLKGGVPFATILRWFPSLEDSTKTGSVLIVTQLLPGGGTCQIARIDAQANKNANEMARQAADSMAGSFDCTQPPQIIGNPGILY